LGFLSVVMIPPQRQTVLVAKQAASVDLLCGGPLRLGIGTGWNDLEYEALGVPFDDRGARIEEQVTVLRKLWTENAVTFDGGYHSIPDVGPAPMRAQRPIPTRMGGGSDRPLFNQKAGER
jgi:alkanesulfonate monooxygenase SsuD/methylene tetrahydromethanopterin reductase-like flavin-dependent oxidoreductase (luciferase family)